MRQNWQEIFPNIEQTGEVGSVFSGYDCMRNETIRFFTNLDTLHPELLCQVSFPFHQPKHVRDADGYNGRPVEPTALQTIGKKLKYYRIVNNLRQIDVARAAGIEEGTYISYEKGERDYYPADKLKKIAEVYGLTLEDLIDEYNRFFLRDVGGQVREIRKQFSFTQKQLADKITVPLSKVKAWEQKGTRPTKANWERLAALSQRLLPTE